MSNMQQEWKEQEYAKSGGRDAQRYVTHDPVADVPLATYQERITAWIENAPYEQERLCRVAYLEAFKSELSNVET